MAEETFILIQGMLFAPKPVLVLQLGMTFPAPILVTLVFLAPEPALVAPAGIADETQFLRRIVGALGAAECRRSGRRGSGAVLVPGVAVSVVFRGGLLFFAAAEDDDCQTYEERKSSVKLVAADVRRRTTRNVRCIRLLTSAATIAMKYPG